MRRIFLILFLFLTSFHVFSTDFDESPIGKVIVKKSDYSGSNDLYIYLKNTELPISFCREGEKKIIFSVLIGELTPQTVSDFTKMFCKSFYYKCMTQIPETSFDFLGKLKKTTEKTRFIDVETEKIIAEKIGYEINDGTNYYNNILNKLRDEISEGEQKYIDFSLSNKRKNYSSFGYFSQITYISRKNSKLSISYKMSRVSFFCDCESYMFCTGPRFNEVEEKCFAERVSAEIIKNILLGKKSYRYYCDIISSFDPGYIRSLKDFLYASPGMEESQNNEIEILVDEAIKQKLEEKI